VEVVEVEAEEEVGVEAEEAHQHQQHQQHQQPPNNQYPLQLMLKPWEDSLKCSTETALEPMTSLKK
jgi:hypothetical protein